MKDITYNGNKELLKLHKTACKRIRFDALHTIGPSIGQAAESCIP